jgi:hypothetical protein
MALFERYKDGRRGCWGLPDLNYSTNIHVGGLLPPTSGRDHYIEIVNKPQHLPVLTPIQPPSLSLQS